MEVGQSVIDRYSKIIKDFVDDAVTLTSSSSSSRNYAAQPPFDDATIAVMERLNLHDALVRIPMNHGDLGPNSQVGHADHLCSRRMNKAPLSDFFAAPSAVREGQISEHHVEASLWMHDSPPVLAESNGPDAERECTIDGEPEERMEGNDEENRTKSHKKGIPPSHPKFLFLAVGFFYCVYLSSHIL